MSTPARLTGSQQTSCPADQSAVQPAGRPDDDQTPGRGRLHGRALGVDIVAVMTSSAATGVLGFAFWTAAARGYDTTEVGRASAIISSATLIAILANFSLGSLYERFLPLAGEHTQRLVRTGTAFVAAAALLFGAVFLLAGPREELFPRTLEMALFPASVAILAVYALQDQVLIGLGRARTIAVKNIGQSTTKLIAVVALIPVGAGAAIVWSWILPAAFITAAVAYLVIRRESLRCNGTPSLPARRELFGFFASSYAINAVGITVPLLLPLIVVAKLGTEMNAYFSMCWLVINTLGVLVGATAAPFIATASTPGADLRSCTQRFVLLCGGAALAGCLALFIAAPWILAVLGPRYAENGTVLIRIMALTLPAVAVTTVYTALARLRRRLALAVSSQVALGVAVVTGVLLTTPRWGINAIGYTYLAAEAFFSLILIVPTVALLRRAVAVPSEPPAVGERSAAGTPGCAQFCETEHDPELDLEYSSVPACFEQVAVERRAQTALRTGERSMTYGELQAAAERWTRALRARSDPGAAVALIADLSPDTAALILGSFAACAPLVPLDPGLPDERLAQIFAALSERGHRVGTVVDGDRRPPATESSPSDPAVRPPLRPQSVTSIQFTSGSSGEPKAVLHVHGTWLADWILLQDRFGIGAGTVVALCMPVSFAAGLNVLIGSLLSGALVIAIDPRNCTPEDALARLRSADVVMCTPSFLQSLTDTARTGTRPADDPVTRTLDGVRRIVTTGEPVYSNVLRRARKLAPNAVLTNWAGSSETLGIAHYDIRPGDEVPVGVIPAGRAAPYKRLDVDDSGRLTVTSPYLAAGYLDPAGAATTFVDNLDGSRTFVTNDRARISESGELVVLGRMDAAVKIRGYLVEPAEVEAALLGCAGVREALVVARHNRQAPVLAAYVAPTPGTRSPAVADIRAQLHARLPSWMVPTHIVMLAALPRNDRGKVDRQALPAPRRGPITRPEAGLEAEIASLWADVLHLDTVGRDENFYALGGDSLNVQQVLGAVGSRYHTALMPSDLAAAPTVAQFATLLDTRRGGAPGRMRPAPTTVVLRAPDATTRDTWFCFAGAGASALSFAPLADRVGADTAVVAFQAQGLENRALPDWTVAAAARRHLAAILESPVAGPYTLIGHSLGAFVATEVANRLRELGHQVDLVAMLDPFLPARTVRAARRVLPDATSTLLEQDPVDRSVLWRRRLRLPLAGLAGRTPGHKVQALREVGVRVGRLHKPRRYDGRTLLVLSTFNLDDARVWPQLLTGDLQIERVNCDHDSVIREPHIRRVVDLVAAARHQSRVAGSSSTSPITP